MLLALIHNCAALLITAVIFATLIWVHEIGHLLMAKAVGSSVETFSIGFGPPFQVWKWRGIQWQLCYFPFGGYVKIAAPAEQSPAWKRIVVAAAGPLANLIFALAAFSLLWLGGGRQRSFAQQTASIGWVDPRSHLYQQGLRPGDRLISCGRWPCNSWQDLIAAACLEPGPLPLVAQRDPSRSPFTVQLDLQRDSRKKLLSNALLAPVSQLIYAPTGRAAARPELQRGDRIVWVNGQPIFSIQQLFHTLQAPTALCTVRRGERTFLQTIPRLQLRELQLTPAARGDIDDWRYEKELDRDLLQLFFIPYALAPDCTVTAALSIIDSSADRSPPLQVGDQIIAVWGIPITEPNALLEQLQTVKTVLIVQRGSSTERPFSPQSLASLAKSVGSQQGSTARGALHLLPPLPRSSCMALPLRDAIVGHNPLPLALLTEVAGKMVRVLVAIASSWQLQALAGPVGVIGAVHHSCQLGLGEALFAIGAISINLALFNLLPLPLLDGGQIVWALYEGITRRQLSKKASERIIFPFFLLLLALLLLSTYHDLQRLLR